MEQRVRQTGHSQKDIAAKRAQEVTQWQNSWRSAATDSTRGAGGVAPGKTWSTDVAVEPTSSAAPLSVIGLASRSTTVPARDSKSSTSSPRREKRLRVVIVGGDLVEIDR